MNTFRLIQYLVPATIILIACSDKQEPAEQVPGLIEITNQQFTTDSMQLGEVESIIFENTVKCNGNIVPLPKGIALVNAPLSGAVKNIYCQNGQFVKKDQILLEISGNEIIDIQKDFVEASSIFSRLKNEYERNKSLYNEKVTSDKDFIIVESEYKTALAKYNGLRMKIEAIGFLVSEIENKGFYPSYTIKAPIHGYISNLKAIIGGYIDTQSELIEIIDPTMLQVQLSVFTNNIHEIKKGQTVRFRSMNSTNLNLATISSIGVAVDNDSKSIDCYATISDRKSINTIAYEFVESEIVTSIDTVYALPTNAILSSETGKFILVLKKQEDDKYLFEKLEVNTGRQYNEFTELMGKKIDHVIATKGVYNISL